MATLYELTNQYQMLLEMMQDPDVDPDVLSDTMEGLDGEIEDKADAYAKVRLELVNYVAALKAEIARLTARVKSAENNIDRLTESLKNGMILTGKTKFRTDLFSFNIQKNPPKVVIDDQDLIPAYFFIPQPSKIDTAAIKDLLKKGDEKKELEGAAHLEQGESLRIR